MGYVENVFNGMSEGLQSVLNAFGLLLGVILIFVAVWKFFKAVTDSNQRVSNIFVGLAALLVGGFLSLSTYENLSSISQGLGQQINDWGVGQ